MPDGLGEIEILAVVIDRAPLLRLTITPEETRKSPPYIGYLNPDAARRLAAGIDEALTMLAPLIKGKSWSEPEPTDDNTGDPSGA